MKKQLTLAVALVAFGSTSAFAGSTTKVVNDEYQGRIYGGLDVHFHVRFHFQQKRAGIFHAPLHIRNDEAGGHDIFAAGALRLEK